MKRSLQQPVDHDRDRDRWVALIRDVHAAVAEPMQPHKELGDLATRARDLWTSPGGWPRGLSGRAFAALTLAWSRQTDPAERARITPVLIELAGIVDAVLADGPLRPAVPQAEASAPRLPYAEN